MGKKKKKEKLDTYCRACGRRQFKEKKVVTCARGHDGPVGMDKAEKTWRDKKKKGNSVNSHIYIQIGDDEEEHGDLYYRIIGSQGQFVLRAYRADDEYNSTDDCTVTKEKVVESHHGNIHWIIEKLLTHELTNRDAATLEELLEVFKSIETKMGSLEEHVYYLSDDGDDEDDDEE